MITQAFLTIIAIFLCIYHSICKKKENKTNLYYAIDELIKANFSSSYKQIQQEKVAKKKAKRAKNQKKALRRAVVAHAVIKNFDDMIKRS